MSLYPSAPDTFVDRTGSDVISSSDPNNAYEAIENIQNFMGASGEPQSKMVTLINLFRAMFTPAPACSYIDAETISVAPSQVALFNVNNFVIKRNTVATTCILSADLLNGSEAASTWYDLYMIGDGANTQFTLGFLGQGTDASAYATYYARIGTFRNDGASDIVPCAIRDKTLWFVNPQAVAMGTQGGGVFLEADLTSIVPLIGDEALIYVSHPSAGSSRITLRSALSGTVGGQLTIGTPIANAPFNAGWLDIEAGTVFAKAIDYHQSESGQIATAYVKAIRLGL